MIVCPYLGILKEFKVLDLSISLLLLSYHLLLLILKSQILPSPTTGTFPAQSLNYNNNGLLIDKNEIKYEDTTPPLFLPSVGSIFAFLASALLSLKTF